MRLPWKRRETQGGERRGSDAAAPETAAPETAAPEALAAGTAEMREYPSDEDTSSAAARFEERAYQEEWAREHGDDAVAVFLLVGALADTGGLPEDDEVLRELAERHRGTLEEYVQVSPESDPTAAALRGLLS